MRDMDVKILSAVDGIATAPESRMLSTENENPSENAEETKTVTRRTKK